MKALLISCLAVILCSSVAAQVPKIISYQGFLATPDGDPLGGDYEITVSFTDNTGTVKWTETHPAVVTNGQFDLHIGSVGSLDEYLSMMQPGDRLELTVNGDVLAPSSMLTSVPYALEAQQMGGRDWSTYLRRNEAQSTTADAADAVIRIENTGAGRGLTVVSAGQHAVYGRSTSAQAAVEGEAAGTGAGLRGSSVASHGTIGYSSAADKAGVFGNSSTGTGLWGNSGDGFGVYGHSAGNFGVYGHTLAVNEGKPAVFGWSEGMGDGVYGKSQNRHGVVGLTHSSSSSDAGVYARNDGAGPAIYADGSVVVADGGLVIGDGSLRVQGGSFSGDVGLGGAPFPRPAFDSGWIEVGSDATVPLGAGLYLPPAQYDRDNFVVDLMTHGPLGQPGNWGASVYDCDSSGYCFVVRGAHYTIDDNNDITVRVGEDEDKIHKIRVRVWYYR